MPIYNTITVNPGTTVYIWKIDEPESELSRGIKLTPACQSRLEGMRSELHRRGFLSIRHLMAAAGYQDEDLFYDENGKPHLKDGRFISITHSNHFTGIILSDKQKVGIDIERQRDKILKIANRFTPLREYKSLANSEALIRKLTIVWGAKESLYKIDSTPGLSFLHHIDVADFSMEDSSTTAEIYHKGNKSDFNIEFLEFEGFTCVYAYQTN